MAGATYYGRSRHCYCARCRCRGLTGAAVLITLGVLFLLQEFWVLRFEQSWPVLLVVIGVMTLLGRTASTENHIQPEWMSPPAPPSSGPQADPWAGGSVSSGAPEASASNPSADSQVKQ